jgi:hypothetical protein
MGASNRITQDKSIFLIPPGAKCRQLKNVGQDKLLAADGGPAFGVFHLGLIPHPFGDAAPGNGFGFSGLEALGGILGSILLSISW